MQRKRIEKEPVHEEEPVESLQNAEAEETYAESEVTARPSERIESDAAAPGTERVFYVHRSAVQPNSTVFADDLESDLRRKAIRRRQLQLQPASFDSAARSRGEPGLSADGDGSGSGSNVPRSTHGEFDGPHADAASRGRKRPEEELSDEGSAARAV